MTIGATVHLPILTDVVKIIPLIIVAVMILLRAGTMKEVIQKIARTLTAAFMTTVELLTAIDATRRPMSLLIHRRAVIHIKLGISY